jgi:hypothetical protein
MKHEECDSDKTSIDDFDQFRKSSAKSKIEDRRSAAKSRGQSMKHEECEIDETSIDDFDQFRKSSAKSKIEDRRSAAKSRGQSMKHEECDSDKTSIDDFDQFRKSSAKSKIENRQSAAKSRGQSMKHEESEIDETSVDDFDQFRKSSAKSKIENILPECTTAEKTFTDKFLLNENKISYGIPYRRGSELESSRLSALEFEKLKKESYRETEKFVLKSKTSCGSLAREYASKFKEIDPVENVLEVLSTETFESAHTCSAHRPMCTVSCESHLEPHVCSRKSIKCKASCISHFAKNSSDEACMCIEHITKNSK